MEIIDDLGKLHRVVQAGARGWQKSDQFKTLYFWNTTGREHVVDFPTIYAEKSLLEKTTARLTN